MAEKWVGAEVGLTFHNAYCAIPGRLERVLVQDVAERLPKGRRERWGPSRV